MIKKKNKRKKSEFQKTYIELERRLSYWSALKIEQEVEDKIHQILEKRLKEKLDNRGFWERLFKI